MGCTSTCQKHGSCIRRVPVFQRVTEAEEQLLESITHSTAYAKGSYVFQEGERSDSLFVLQSGLVKLSKLADNGKEHILRLFFPGDFFGQFALLQEKNHYAHAEVIEPSVVCRLHRDAFKPLLERNPNLAYGFLLGMSEQLKHADEWAGALHVLEVDRRLAKMLLYLRNKHAAEANADAWIPLPASKKEVAAMIGATPETLSRKLAQLEGERLLQMDKRSFRILDVPRMQELSGAMPAEADEMRERCD